jgi:hypothetical protein
MLRDPIIKKKGQSLETRNIRKACAKKKNGRMLRDPIIKKKGSFAFFFLKVLLLKKEKETFVRLKNKGTSGCFVSFLPPSG